MRYGNSVHRLPRIRSYHDAHQYFTKRDKPPRSKKWCDNSRPLKSVGDTHYAIHRGETTRGRFYDLALYETTLVRYWQPDDIIADGTEHVWLRGYDTQMSWSFLDRAGWWRGRDLRTTTGDTAKLVLNPENLSCDGWSAHLVFKDDKLVVAQSKHAPVYVYKSSREDTERRAKFKQDMDTFATLMCYRIPTMHSEMSGASYWDLYGRGKPFGGLRLTLPWAQNTPSVMLKEQNTERLVRFADEVYHTMIAKRWYDRWEDRENRRLYGTDHTQYIPPQLDADVYKKGLLSALLRHSGCNANSLRVEVPQFANKLPNDFKYF